MIYAKVVGYNEEIKKYLESVKTATEKLDVKTIKSLVNFTLDADSATLQSSKQIAELVAQQIAIVGKHNVLPNGMVRPEVLNALSGEFKTKFAEYSAEVNALNNSEVVDLTVPVIADSEIVLCDDLTAYRLVRAFARESIV